MYGFSAKSTIAPLNIPSIIKKITHFLSGQKFNVSDQTAKKPV